MEYPSQISVIIPVYNGGLYIESAIESVLAQTYPATEIIVVNDGSIDNSAQIINKFKKHITYLKKEHSGLGDSLNQGITSAQGGFIAFNDADDLWVENKLELQMAAFNKTDVDMVFGYVQQFISPELDETAKFKILCQDEPMQGYSTGTMMVKTDAFFKVGLFSIKYRVGEFIEWYMRAKNLGLESLLLPNIIAKRRLHQANMTGQAAGEKTDYARILKTGLDLRRTQKKQNEN